MIDITVFSDFTCPYCYIGENRLINAIRDINATERVNITYHAYQLDKHAPKDPNENLAERLVGHNHHMPDRQIQERVNQIDQLGHDQGLIFKCGTAPFANTRDAHRLMKMAQAKYPAETVERLNFALFDAVFGLNLNIADPNVLTNVAREVKISDYDIADALNNEVYNQQVLDDENLAKTYGVHAVPFVVIRKKQIHGAVSTEDYKQALLAALDHVTPEHLHDAKPHACSASGCTNPER